jgi:ribose transport system substrate-binding protein
MQLKYAVSALALVASLGLTATAFAAGHKVVPGPAADPVCFKPWSADTKFFQFPKKDGPYRIALANGFVGNTWRIQMIQTAKAYAAQPDVAAKIKEFKVVSTGEDIAAQIAAVDNFINSGFDAIIVNAQNPAAFKPVIKRANAKGVVLVAFDNTLDTDEAINVNVDQKALGKLWTQWVVDNVPEKAGKILEVRGVSGTSVDRDRHEGVLETVKNAGGKFEIVEVQGNWDEGTTQKVVADAVAVHKSFVGVSTQGGSAGVVRALVDSGHPYIPIGGETENGFRKLCAAHASEGLKCLSAGTGPAQVAVAMKTALAALAGEVVPQSVALPLSEVHDPDFKNDENFYSDQSDNFFVGNSFPTCGINFSAQEIMGQTKQDQ